MTLLDQMIGGIWTLMRLVPCTDSIPGEYPCNMCKLLNRINDGHSTLHRKDSMCKHLFTTWMAELPSSEKKRVMKIKLNYLKDLNLVCHWICSSNFEWHNIYQLNYVASWQQVKATWGVFTFLSSVPTLETHHMNWQISEMWSFSSARSSNKQNHVLWAYKRTWRWGLSQII